MTITIYSTPTCPYCKMAKEYLTGKGIEYTEVDVAADPAKAQEMVQKSGQMGVPVLDINGEIIVGFNKAAIDKALAKGESGDIVTSEEPAEGVAGEDASSGHEQDKA